MYQSNVIGTVELRNSLSRRVLSGNCFYFLCEYLFFLVLLRIKCLFPVSTRLSFLPSSSCPSPGLVSVFTTYLSEECRISRRYNT